MLVKRFPEAGITRLIDDDGRHEDFRSIRGAIVWPDEESPGVLLVGGLKEGSEVAKVLDEHEFRTLSQAEDVIDKVAERFMPWSLYYPNIPESETWITFLAERFRDHWHIAPWRFQPAPGSERPDFCLALIEEALKGERLVVPRDGLLDRELQAGLHSVVSEKKPHGVLALGCLISGFLGDADGRGKGLLSERQFADLFT